MTETLHHTRRPTRGLSRTALLMFFLVYAAALVLLIAPKDMFTATPGSLIQPDE
jgi:hypothetical protein